MNLKERIEVSFLMDNCRNTVCAKDIGLQASGYAGDFRRNKFQTEELTANEKQKCVSSAIQSSVNLLTKVFEWK